MADPHFPPDSLLAARLLLQTEWTWNRRGSRPGRASVRISLSAEL